MPDGTCDARCTPVLEDMVKECDDALANGEISEIEHYKQSLNSEPVCFTDIDFFVLFKI